MIDLRAEDANTINDHLPLIAARLNSATTTPEMVTLIANKVRPIKILVVLVLTHLRFNTPPTAARTQTQKT